MGFKLRFPIQSKIDFNYDAAVSANGSKIRKKNDTPREA